MMTFWIVLLRIVGFALGKLVFCLPSMRAGVFFSKTLPVPFTMPRLSFTLSG